MRPAFIYSTLYDFLFRFPDKFHYHPDHRWAIGAGWNGDINATFDELVEAFGEPNDCDDEGNVRWTMLFDGNIPAWIENGFLDTEIPQGKHRWYVGGISRDVLACIAHVLGTNEVEYLTEEEERKRDNGRPISVLRYLVGKPSWTALENQVPERLRDQFMYIGYTHSDSGTRVHLYKHKDTRRYLLLSDNAAAWRYADGGQQYCVPTDLNEALRHVFSFD